MRETDEEDYWTGTSRFMACVMVDKHDLKSVFKGPPPHKYDTFTEQHVTLVSANRKEGVYAGVSVIARTACVLAAGWMRLGELC